MINIDSLYDLMAEKGFQDPTTGNLFFPAYIYTYPAKQEYAIRKQFELLTSKLERPSNYLDCLVLNIFDEIMDYLKNEKAFGKSVFDLILEKEKENYDESYQWIRREINDGDFYEHFEKKVTEYFEGKSDKRVYLLVHGFGSAYPYLRASEFLKKTERLIKHFKIIMFYPGEYANSNFKLFGELEDDNIYRVNHINKLIES